ncbi:cytochrome C oxidase subunit IV family protein [Kiritimatiellaeota bacterium B1221]|nr:cytochrome C oxidase subunit IV family protein [Kiritimatiellaeota bacterium B1221]
MKKLNLNINPAEFTDDHGHTSVKGYFAVFFALMFFTLLTVLMHLVNFGLLGNAICAMSIAVMKASLVIYFFMHVRESPKIIALVVVASFAWLSILFLFTIADFSAMYGDGPGNLNHPLPW